MNKTKLAITAILVILALTITQLCKEKTPEEPGPHITGTEPQWPNNEPITPQTEPPIQTRKQKWK